MLILNKHRFETGIIHYFSITNKIMADKILSYNEN